MIGVTLTTRFREPKEIEKRAREYCWPTGVLLPEATRPAHAFRQTWRSLTGVPAVPAVAAAGTPLFYSLVQAMLGANGP